MRYLAVAVLAALFASAATATASHLITGKQIARNTITSSNVKNGALTWRDLRAGTITQRNLSANTAEALQATVATTKVTQSEPIVISAGDYNPKSVSVMCPEGQVALGGGGGLVNRPDLGQIGASEPIVNSSGVARGWTVFARPGAPGAEAIETYAICSP